MGTERSGRVVVVPDADGARGGVLARSTAEWAGALVLAGADVDALGELAAELTASGARVAIFVGDVATDTGRAGLREMVNELFPDGS